MSFHERWQVGIRAVVGEKAANTAMILFETPKGVSIEAVVHAAR
jgi:hypothetical protein